MAGPAVLIRPIGSKIRCWPCILHIFILHFLPPWPGFIFCRHCRPYILLSWLASYFTVMASSYFSVMASLYFTVVAGYILPSCRLHILPSWPGEVPATSSDAMPLQVAGTSSTRAATVTAALRLDPRINPAISLACLLSGIASLKYQPRRRP